MENRRGFDLSPKNAPARPVWGWPGRGLHISLRRLSTRFPDQGTWVQPKGSESYGALGPTPSELNGEM